VAREEAGGGHKVDGQRAGRTPGQRRSGCLKPPLPASMDSGAEWDEKEGGRGCGCWYRRRKGR
jgi:hypothetical protein